MRGLIRQSVRRPVAVSMLYVAVGLLAVGAWVNLPIDVQITGEFPEVHVTTRWGQASPEAVQALITSPIESLAVTIPGVRHVRSETSRGSSSITIELAEDVDVDLVTFELQDRLGLLREELPPGAAYPQVSQIVPREFADINQESTFMRYMLRSPRSLNALREWAIEELQTPLSAVDGVAAVNVIGGQDPYLRVALDPALCELYGINTFAVRSEIVQLSQTEPLGQVEMDETAYAVRIQNVVEDLDTLRNLALGQVGNNIVRLSDVGTVQPAYEDADQYSRIDGNQVVTVALVRRSGADVLSVAEAAKERMAQLGATFPADIATELIYDQADELAAEFQLLGRRLAMILLIVAALLFLMLRDVRTPLFLFGTLAAAVSLAVIALYHFEVPVNLLTITGLALAFGMLVDNAVVVLENIVRYREAGLEPQVAAERGTAEVVVPVLAATATTIGVFVPFVLFQGRLRDYYTPLALAVAFSLTASFMVALTMMPAAAGKGWVIRAPRVGREPGPRYRRSLAWGLRHPWIVLAVVALIGWQSYRIFQENVPRSGFRLSRGRERLYVRLSLPPGAEAATADEQIRRFEDYVLGLPDIERVEVNIDNQTTRAGYGPLAYMQVLFPPDIETTAYPLIVKDELIGMATGFAGVQISVSGFNPDGYYSGGFSLGSSSNSGIELLGYNYEELGRFGEEIAATAMRHPRVQEAEVTSGTRWYRSQGTELVLRIKRDVLTPYGVTVNDVINEINALLAGETAPAPTRVGTEDWDLRVKVDGVDQRTLRDLLAAPVSQASPTAGSNGRGLRMGDVIEAQFRTIPGSITREDQRYQRYVRWEYRGSPRARAAYEEAIFEGIELPPGYMARIEQSSFLTREERRQIREVAITALIIVFLILASLYESLIQPFVVLLSVPCALIGVFLIFYFTQKPFDPSASIGVVLLGGIVVNNAIILVDHINLRRRDGLELVEAIVTGAAERVRPILITSITTVGGLLPLVVLQPEEAMQGNQQLWSNLALATIGGLSAATVLTLTIIPILYMLAERARHGARQLWLHVARTWRSLPA